MNRKRVARRKAVPRGKLAWVRRDQESQQNQNNHKDSRKTIKAILVFASCIRNLVPTKVPENASELCEISKIWWV